MQYAPLAYLLASRLRTDRRKSADVRETRR